MPVFRHSKALRTELEKSSGASVGFVPTMGFLHDGHLSLIEKAASENDTVVVSIFVNPTQFNNSEDLEKYPRDVAGDIEKIHRKYANTLIFIPETEDLYPNGASFEKIDFQGLDQVMEGRFRPGHFQGVGAVVQILFDIVRPNLAYFGEKDFQQLLIIKYLTAYLKLPIRIIGCPTLREPNGLAMSSRNERLSPAARLQAGLIYDTLSQAKDWFRTMPAEAVKSLVNQAFERHPAFHPEYVEIADEQTLKPVRKASDGRCRLFVAVFIEHVRLIDNILLN